EVLDGFGELAPAIDATAEACALDGDDLDLRLKYADRLNRAERYDEALAQLDRAATLAEKDDEVEAVLEAQVRNYRAAGRLAGEIAALRKGLDAGEGVTAARWMRLARLLEADQKVPEALAAARRALAVDGRSVPAWQAAARLDESAGDLGAAA